MPTGGSGHTHLIGGRLEPLCDVEGTRAHTIALACRHLAALAGLQLEQDRRLRALWRDAKARMTFRLTRTRLNQHDLAARRMIESNRAVAELQREVPRHGAFVSLNRHVAGAIDYARAAFRARHFDPPVPQVDAG